MTLYRCLTNYRTAVEKLNNENSAAFRGGITFIPVPLVYHLRFSAVLQGEVIKQNGQGAEPCPCFVYLFCSSACFMAVATSYAK